MTYITLIATGGTIASRAQQPEGPVTEQLAGDDLLARVPYLPQGVEVRVQNRALVGSYELTLADVYDLAQHVRTVLCDADCLGVVITHGTDTMEETAFALDLLIDDPRPVVLTGAQRNAGAPDSDGPRNIADALCVAASVQARALGAMILFEDSRCPRGHKGP